MKLRSCVLLIAVISMTLGLSSCTKKKKEEGKVFYYAASADVKGFDPIYGDDSYSGREIARVYDGLLQYHYLKRPYELEPNLAQAMPTVSNDGMSYTFKLLKGVKFHDSEVFPNRKGREVVAEDVKYSFLRVADPKLSSTGWWVIDGKIAGVKAWRDQMAKAKATDYNANISGIQVIDSHTIKFTLAKPFPQFLYAFAMSFFKIVPKEAVDKYGKEFVNHPVGTGPFTLKKYDRTKKIVYYKNPNFREKFYPTEGGPGDKEKGLLASAGKKVPFVDKVVVNIINETQPRWLNFLKGKIDLLIIPKDNFDEAITPDRGLQKGFSEKGMDLFVTPGIDVTYNAFNHDVKIFKNVHLRRAMSLAYNVGEANKLFYNMTGLPAQSIVPPGIAGYEKDYVSPYAKFDLEEAKKELKKAGYNSGADVPEITYEALATTLSRNMAEFFSKSMAKIGIKVKVSTNTWPEMTKKIKGRRAQMWGISWLADYPDAENFLQLIYGPNSAPGANGSNFNHKEFNALFKKAALMQHSPERTALYNKLRIMSAELVPWIYGVHRMNFSLKHGWLKNFKDHVFPHGMALYYDIDKNAKGSLKDKL